MVNVVMWFPAYVMLSGIVVLALGFCMPALRSMAAPDFEKILPMVLSNYVPAGLLGLMVAGFMAAFMSNFAATLNAAPAYLVNDIYKRFINPDVPNRMAVRLSRIASFVVLAMGIALGLMTTRITDVMMWLVGALYSGFVVSNVLKWYWWRFNGFGYFWGMVSGIGSAMIVPVFARKLFGENVNMLYCFPAIFAISAASSVLGTLYSEPEDDETLIEFYKNVRPWGAWGRIRDLVTKDDPSFQPNRDCARNWVNIVVGIVWQLSIFTTPIYLVTRNWPWFWVCLSVFVAAITFLKFNWYDKLERDTDVQVAADEQPETSS